MSPFSRILRPRALGSACGQLAMGINQAQIGLRRKTEPGAQPCPTCWGGTLYSHLENGTLTLETVGNP